MNKRQIDDDDDLFDEHGLLRDGKTYRVPMSARDSLTPLQRAVAASQLHDAHGRPAGHRPGFVFDAGSDARDAMRELYRQHDAEEAERWRRPTKPEPIESITGVGSHGFTGAHEGDMCTVRGPEYPKDFGSPGHLWFRQGKLVCVPDEPRSDSHDAAPKSPAEHRRNMDQIYAEYDAEQQSAWRKPG
jgi:hypothetical protein